MSFIINPYVFAQPISGLWDPSQLTGLVTWYDPSDAGTLTLNGSNVEQMDDKSGNGNHASNLTTSQQPDILGTINSLIALKFDGGDKLVSPEVATALNGQIAVSIFLVMNGPSVANQGLIGLNSTIGHGFFIIDQSAFFSNEVNMIRSSVPFAGNPYTYGSSNSFVPQQDITIGLCADLTNQVRFFVDGTDQTSFQGDLGTGPMSLTDFSIGFGGQGFYKNNGLVGEIVITNTYLSLSDRQKLEGYLAWKWGTVINLDPSNPYKNSPPTV